jgi:putative membrane protein
MVMQWLAAWLPWIKFVHLSALLAWCACLFTLPALLTLYPETTGRIAKRRLVAATRFVYVAVASPAAVLAVVSGTLMIHVTGSYAVWLLAKLTLVAAMVFFHIGCGKLILVLRKTPRRWPAPFHVALVIVPALLIPGVLWLVLAQPRF